MNGIKELQRKFKELSTVVGDVRGLEGEKRYCVVRFVSLFAPNNFVSNSGAREVFYAMNTIPAMLAVRIGSLDINRI